MLTNPCSSDISRGVGVGECGKHPLLELGSGLKLEQCLIVKT